MTTVLIVIGVLVGIWLVAGFAWGAISSLSGTRQKQERAQAIVLQAQLPEGSRDLLVKVFAAFKADNAKAANQLVETREPDTSALLRAFARPRDPHLSAGKIGNALNLEVWTKALKDRGYSPAASSVIAYIHYHYLESALAEQVSKLEQPMEPAEAPMPPQQPVSADEMIALPEWLEEKATDAPTMMRVMIDVVERQLRRDHPNALLASEWAQFKQHAIVAGCSSLALRLHKEVPEAYRTPLELAMRDRLELASPGSESLYRHCAHFVAEHLVEIQRSERRRATFLLDALWVVGAVSEGQRLDEDVIAKLAQVYENETHGYWASAD